MEDTLREVDKFIFKIFQRVLILVLMEDTLRALAAFIIAIDIQS